MADIRVRIFDKPTPAGMRRVYPNHIVLSGEDLTDAGLPRRIASSFDEDLFIIPIDYDIIPTTIETRLFGRKRLDNDYRKFWKRAEILTLNTGVSPAQSFQSRMLLLSAEDCVRAYSWKAAGPRIYVPLTALIDGRNLYFTVTHTFPELGIRDRVDIDSYGSETVVKIPSRSMEEVKRYTIGFRDVSTRESGLPWYMLIPSHACEDKEYKLRTEGYFMDDHIVGAHTALEITRSQTSDPLINRPFLIPSRMLATFDQRLREQVIKLYYPRGSNEPAERNLREAERELLLWRFIAIMRVQDGQRAYNRLFADTYDGVGEYMALKPKV